MAYGGYFSGNPYFAGSRGGRMMMGGYSPGMMGGYGGYSPYGGLYGNRMRSAQGGRDRGQMMQGFADRFRQQQPSVPGLGRPVEGAPNELAQTRTQNQSQYPDWVDPIAAQSDPAGYNRMMQGYQQRQNNPYGGMMGGYSPWNRMASMGRMGYGYR